MSLKTKATLTLNSFEKNGDDGGPSACDKQFHSDDLPVVALSTGWLNKKSRCLNNITIYGNGRRVRAMVVDECDSAKGCDTDHDYNILMLLKRFGRRSVCQKVTGDTWTYNGLTLGITSILIATD